MNPITLADDDVDDPIVWQVGKMLPDGRIRMFVMRKSDEERMLKAAGHDWLETHKADLQADIAAWGVQ